MVASCAGAALAVISFRFASPRSARSSRMSRPASSWPSATCACFKPKSARAGGCRSSSAGTRCIRLVGTGGGSVPQGRLRACEARQPERRSISRLQSCWLRACAGEAPRWRAGDGRFGGAVAAAPRSLASSSQFEDRDARGPGAAGRHIAPGGRHIPRTSRLRRLSRLKSPWRSRASRPPNRQKAKGAPLM